MTLMYINVTGPKLVLQWLPRFSIVLSRTQLRSGGSTICAGSDRLPGTRLNQITDKSSESIPTVSDGLLLVSRLSVLRKRHSRDQPAYPPAFAGEILIALLLNDLQPGLDPLW